ncbi:MAG: hypothetical protein FWC81_02835 [Coriobacteriia bacterium]|nr:hypothetical protein [Coriobacteriia bacterium]
MRYTFAIRDDGTLWAWGANSNSQLGLGDTVQRLVPTLISTANVSGSNWTSVTAGRYHALAIRDDRTLWSWGPGNSGRLGIGTVSAQASPARVRPTLNNTNTWSAASAGAFHALALCTDDILWSFGLNSSGQLGTGDTIHRLLPNKVLMPGVDAGGQDTGSLDPSDTIQISTGQDHSLAVHADGTLWAWGRNNQGQLGLGDTDNRDTPTQVPDEEISGSRWISASASNSYSIGLRDDGTLWAWGFGQLGIGSTGTAPILNPAQVSTDDVTGNKWLAVSAGNSHSVAVRCDGTLWAWGSVGNVSRLVPDKVGIANNDGWRMVSVGGGYTLAICSDGILWVWGVNGGGQLGLGDTDQRLAPVEVPTAGISGNTWTYVAAGASHAFAIRDDGSLWAWGNNFQGQLGLGDMTNRLAPTLVPAANVSGDNWISVTAGGTGTPRTNFHTLALRDDGTLWGWGSGNDGRLGSDGRLDTDGRLQFGQPIIVTAPIEVLMPRIGENAWTAASAGGNHTLAACANNVLWSFGLNNVGQLGLGDTVQRLLPTEVLCSEGDTSSIDPIDPSDEIQISARTTHSLAVCTDGNLWAWGQNNQGQLGLGDTNSRDIPTQVPDEEISGSRWISAAAGNSYSIGLRDDGTLWSWGATSHGRLGLGGHINPVSVLTVLTPTEVLRVGANSRWISIVVGDGRSFALRDDGSLWAWGDSLHRTLGFGDGTGRIAPTKMFVPGVSDGWKMVTTDSAHTLAICRDGNLWAWGFNNGGQLGFGDRAQRFLPTKVPTAGISGDTWIYVTTGASHTLAIRDDGTLWAWGNGGNGRLGLGVINHPFMPTLVPATNVSGDEWISVTAGSDYTLALRDDGTLWSWGAGANGRLGNGIAAVHAVPTFMQISPAKVQPTSNNANTWITASAGGSHALALCADNALWAFGLNSSGQLGVGDIIQRLIPTKVLMPNADTGGQNADPITPGDTMQISAGANHSLAVYTDGSLWAWGQNSQGQLGLGDTDNRDIPVQVLDEEVSGNRWISAAAGRTHSIGLRDDGTLWAWGTNNFGQLGIGSASAAPTLMPIQVPTAGVTGNKWLAVSAGDGHSVAVRCDGSLWAWGNNSSGRLGLINGVDFVHRSAPDKVALANSGGWKMVTAGDTHVLAICSNGTLWAWGASRHGQLGLGAGALPFMPNRVSTIDVSGDKWIYVATSESHTLALRDDGTLWAWGLNSSGQLGLGDIVQRFVPTLVPTTNVGGDRWIDVTAGSSHTLALRDDGTLWAWGSGGNGRLGDGTTTIRHLPVQVQPTSSNVDTWITAFAGGSQSFALCTDGDLWAWGLNSSGQLGVGDTAQRLVPTEVIKDLP